MSVDALHAALSALAVGATGGLVCVAVVYRRAMAEWREVAAKWERSGANWDQSIALVHSDLNLVHSDLDLVHSDLDQVRRHLLDVAAGHIEMSGRVALHSAMFRKAGLHTSVTRPGDEGLAEDLKTQYAPPPGPTPRRTAAPEQSNDPQEGERHDPDVS